MLGLSLKRQAERCRQKILDIEAKGEIGESPPARTQPPCGQPCVDLCVDFQAKAEAEIGEPGGWWVWMWAG
jgi:hypothetical protein